MKFTTKTEYGLVCLIHMARCYGESPKLVTIKDIVDKEKLSWTYLEKILQRLKAAGIVVSYQGKQGGYQLARHPQQVTLKDIIDALEGATFEVYCEPKIRDSITCTHFTMCGLRPIWEKTKNVLDDLYSSMTLETLAKKEVDVRASVSAA